MGKSWLLVMVQFSAIAYYVATGPIVTQSNTFLIIEAVGLWIGLWAIWVMNPLRVSVFPEPRDDAELNTFGPYRFIRHPMYTAVLLVCFALTLDRQELLDWAVFIGLSVNQWLKLKHEERMLKEKFAGYSEYMNRTKALIPFII